MFVIFDLFVSLNFKNAKLNKIVLKNYQVLSIFDVLTVITVQIFRSFINKLGAVLHLALNSGYLDTNIKKLL
ncbi:hypothetical protein CNR22_10310 [Sphingobacteriaceae bacterium]|nr:hypothetical protein CNR22_10310 [Sphingobacteriaceae bacterium]